MEFTENKKLPHIFSALSKYFSVNVGQPPKVWTAYIVCIILFLIFIIKNKNTQKRKPKSEYTLYADTLPCHRWIPFVNLPLLDSLILFYKLRKEGVRLAEEITKKIGPDVTFSIGFTTAIGVSNPFTIQKILDSTNLGHANKPRFLYDNLLTRLLKDGLLGSKVNTWSHHRKVLTPAFNYKSLFTYFKFINNEAKALAQSAYRAVENVDSEVICNQTMSQLIDHHAVRIVTQIIMGTDSFGFSEEQRISFHESFNSTKELCCHRPELMIPPLWWLHPNRKQIESGIDNIITISNQIIDSYGMKTSVEQSKQGNTSLFSNQPSQNCSAHWDHDDKELGIKSFQSLVELMIKDGFSNKEITDEIATFLLAGHETVKVALDMLVFHLARNQKHQKICQAEVDELFDSKIDAEFDLEGFSKLKYLEMCILESMRLTPIVPFFAREVLEQVKVDDNSVIPPGQLVLICPWALHRNPDIYPNPKNYDPNRFLPANVKQRHPYAFIPFSMGIRNCIGWKIALLEMKAIMAWILRYFEMYTTDDLNDVKFLFDVTLKPERPFNVTFKKRLD